MLKAANVDLYYGAAQALRGVSFSAEIGKVSALMGRNGVGKTSFLRAIIGEQPIAAGEIALDGRVLGRMAPHDRARLGIAYVPQGRDIFARLTVEENLKMGMATLSGREAARISGEVYELFPVLKEMLGRRGGDLSGGQQQQLAIARALLQRPELIILDEPTEGIQPSIIKDIEHVIQMLRQRGDIGILLCEQYFDFARALADKFLVLSRGEVVASGTAAEMDGEHVRRHLAV